MIEIYTSENNYLSLGNGKTLRMVIDGYKFHLANPDYKIFANFECSFADEYFKISDLIDILKNNKNCLIMIDEINVLLNAFEVAKKKSKKATLFFRQPRKRNMYIKTTTQSYNDIQAPIRRLNPIVYVIRKVHRNKTLCYESQNSDCPYNLHVYQKYRIRFFGNTTFTDHVLPDTTGHKTELEINENGESFFNIVPDFYYNLYDSNELILMEEDS